MCGFNERHKPCLVLATVPPSASAFVMSDEEGGRGEPAFPAGYIPYESEAMLSVYNKDYRGTQGERYKSISRQKEEGLRSSPFDASTTNKIDFKPWPRSTVASFKPIPATAELICSLHGNFQLRNGFQGSIRRSLSIIQAFPEHLRDHWSIQCEHASRDDFQEHKGVERARLVVPKGDSSTESALFRYQHACARLPCTPVRNAPLF